MAADRHVMVDTIGNLSSSHEPWVASALEISKNKN